MEAPRPLRKSGLSLYAKLFGSVQRQMCCSVVAAHPNDEIVGGGCLLAKLSNVRILHISNGIARSLSEARLSGFESIADYAEVRRRECLAALSLAGIGSARVADLNLCQFEASSQLVSLTLEVLSFLQTTAAQIVLTHAYEGGHPDHDATAFATHAAVRLLEESGLKPPSIFEMAIYPGRSGMSKVPEFLQRPARESTTFVPNSEARDLKLQMFECFKSQKQILDRSPLGPEKFRQAPGYDFELPPHPGKLYYETFEWGFSGESWRTLASAALKELFERSHLS